MRANYKANIVELDGGQHAEALSYDERRLPLSLALSQNNFSLFFHGPCLGEGTGVPCLN